MEKILFAALTKVVELTDGSVEVWGRAVAEEPDSKKEVLDYEASKPLIKAWSDDIFAASGGQSVGNLRAMHNPRIAAGKLTQMDFLDHERAIDIVAQVIDAEEVKKTRAGVYTGFSIGGSYARKWRDGEVVRYAAQPSEISLADNPMIKSCRITLVKTDGSEEVIEKVAPAGELQKRLHHVRQMALWLYDGRCLLGDLVYEAQKEGDGSPLPGRLQEAFLNLLEIFKELAQEEANELATEVAGLLAGKPAALAMITGQGELEKTMKPDDLRKLEDAVGGLAQVQESLGKLEAAFAAQGEALEKVLADNLELKDRLAKVEAQPAPAKGALKVVDKAQDVQPLGKTGPTQEEIDDMVKNKDTLGLTKVALNKPISL